MDTESIGSRDYLPCNNSKLEFTRALAHDLMRMNKKGIAIIKDLRSDCKNIVKYTYEIQQISKDFKIPSEFDRLGCFQIRVEDFTFFIYNDIASFDNICIMFDIIYHIE